MITTDRYVPLCSHRFTVLEVSLAPSKILPQTFFTTKFSFEPHYLFRVTSNLFVSVVVDSLFLAMLFALESTDLLVQSILLLRASFDLSI